MTEDLRFWKAAEYRSWLLYYSIPILSDLLNSAYLYHYMTLVKSIFILCSDSIGESDLKHAEQLLYYFVAMLNTLYGERYMTLNVHSLLHLPEVVRDLGPLWAHSCFAFEDANGYLKKFFHGTQHVDLQIANAVTVLQTIPQLTNLVGKGTAAEGLINQLNGRRSCKSGRNVSCLGSPYFKQLSSEMLCLIDNYTGRPSTQLLFFKRISLSRLIYHSLDNTRVTSRNSYTCKYRYNSMDCKFGFIQWFGLDGEDVVCCVEGLILCDLGFADPDCLQVNPDHISRVQCSHQYEIIPVESLICMCICVKSENNVFVIEVPNDKEINI